MTLDIRKARHKRSGKDSTCTCGHAYSQHRYSEPHSCDVLMGDAASRYLCACIAYEPVFSTP